MDSLKKIRTEITQQLWQHYLQESPHIAKVVNQCEQLQQPIVLDHFAIIDLPSEHSGIHTLTKIFTALGYQTRGQGYLPEKQNGFSWLTPIDAEQQTATDALPQIVVADFKIEALTEITAKILKKYTQHIKPFDFAQFYQLISQVYKNDKNAEKLLIDLVVNYCQQKDWPAITTEEYCQVKESNELLAWVLTLGRCINHFGLNIHLMPKFNDLRDWNSFIQLDDKIKGGAQTGIAQSSAKGEAKNILLNNGNITLSGPFIEFVWRYPNKTNPQYWQDYFTDFIDYQANRVIESVYE